MSATQADVLDALGRIPEPCSIAMDAPETLLSMGLVESVEIVGTHVDVSLVLTDPSCVHFVSMRRYITDSLCQLSGVESVNVRMSTTQLWTPDLMLPRGAGATPDAAATGRSLLPLA